MVSQVRFDCVLHCIERRLIDCVYVTTKRFQIVKIRQASWPFQVPKNFIRGLCEVV
jgi:hypothetical protein